MRLIDQLGEGDFIPLAEHPLRWRWTDPHWHLLSDVDLAQIRPLSIAKTEELSRKIAPTVGTRFPLSQQFFEGIEECNTAGEPAVVQRWLLDRLPPGVTDLFICWADESTPGLLVPARLFCQYWDDFCYPSSDDVVAWSVHDDWVASYQHEERLWVGRRRP